MSHYKYTYDFIEEYLEGSLTLEEKEAFERDLTSDSTLRTAVKTHQLASELVIENRLLSVKSTLKEIDTSSRSNFLKRWWGGALVLVLLGVLGYVSFQQVEVKKEKAPISIKSASGAISAEKDRIETVQENKQVTKIIPLKIGVVPSAHSEKEIISAIPTAQEVDPTKTVVVLPEENNTVIEKENKAEVYKKIPVPVHLDPCQSVRITAEISTQATCPNKSEGAVYVSQLKGGTAPYSSTLIDEDHQVQTSLTSLPKGKYTLVIKDAKGCVQKMEKVSVMVDKCQYNQIFNPFLGEVWEIPVSQQQGTLKIYDNAGNLYFWKDIVPLDKEQWLGQSQSGEQKTGYFPFEIRYQDGTSLLGSITIVK